MAMPEIISTPEAAPPAGAYSQAVAVGDLVFCAGVTPNRPDGTPVEGDFEEQARAAFANLDAIARAAGCTLDDAIRVGVYLRDSSKFYEMDRLFAEYFSGAKPARTTIPVELDGMEIELDAVLYRHARTSEVRS